MRTILWLAVLLFAMDAHPALARPLSPSDIEVISNSVHYIHGLNKGRKEIRIGLVYDANIPASEAEAKHFQQLLEASASARDAAIMAEPIAIGRLPAKDDLEILYITEGLSSKSAEIYQIAKEKHLFTLSGDRLCVEAKCCILSVRADPAVEILMNEATLQELGFEIDPVYRLMVKQI